MWPMGLLFLSRHCISSVCLLFHLDIGQFERTWMLFLYLNVSEFGLVVHECRQCIFTIHLPERMIYAKFGWNWPSGFGCTSILSSVVISLEQDEVFHLNISHRVFIFGYVQMKRWKCEMFTDRQTDGHARRTWEGKKISPEYSAIERCDHEKWIKEEWDTSIVWLPFEINIENYFLLIGFICTNFDIFPA